MVKFPEVLPPVKPLYSPVAEHRVLRKQRSLELVRRHRTVAPFTRCLSEDATHGRPTHVQPDIEIYTCSDQAKMYEPVADGCATVRTRFAEYQPASAAASDDESCRTHRAKAAKNTDNQLKACVVVPEKPPRRIKLQKARPATTGTAPTATGAGCDKMQANAEHKVDLEDINRLSVDADRNYRNKFLSVGVQASPLPPYRLRVLPKSMRRVKSDPEKCDCGKDRAALCCTATGRWTFSQCGLALIIVVWALLGAAAFHETEGPREREQAEELATLQYNLAVGLASELRQIVPHEPVWLSMVQNYFARHETLLLDAVSSGYGEGGGGGHIWTYPGCLLFAVSLLTTLGFGAPVPRTTLGRGAAVLFSAVGIPLHFLLVLNVGVLAASKLQAWVVRRQNTAANSPGAGSLASTSTGGGQPRWLKWLPALAIVCYYTLGIVLFGLVRRRSFVDSLLFPLDFTATGGVAKTLGHVRILYALYLEVAVTLAATMVSLLQVSASRGIVNFGLRLGLLTNT